MNFVIKKLYRLVFARPSMQKSNDSLLKLALYGHGYNNTGDFKSTGEKLFLNKLRDYNLQVCIDIGANKGNYTKALLESTSSKVISFEPLPGAFNKLLGLQSEYPDRLTVINKGVGNNNCELDLHFGESDSELASFSTEVNEIYYVGHSNTNTIKTEIVTLDSFVESLPKESFSQIDLIKVDTEGYEYEVLLGAKNTIEVMRPKFIQIEYNWHQLFKGMSLFKLASLLPGYVAYQLLPFGSGLSKRDIKDPLSNVFAFSNFVFIREDISV